MLLLTALVASASSGLRELTQAAYATSSSGIPELTGIWSLTPWGLLLGISALVLTSVIRGWFIPAKTHERIVAELEKRILLERARGDEWKGVADERGRVVSTQGELLGNLQEVGHVVTAVLRASTPPGVLDGTTQEPPQRGG